MQEIQETIYAFILENFLFGQADHLLTNDSSLVERGVLNSTGVLELVAFIEDQFDMEVDDSELINDNFGSINAIVSYINKKTAEACHA